MALTAQRSNQPEKWTRKRFTLAANNAAYKGGIACLSLSGGAAPGKVVIGGTATTLFFIGTFAENKATSVSDQLVDVDLGDEIEIRWYVNGSASIAATDVGGVCYIVDDTTVAKSGTGKSLAGRIWAVDASKGVAVQKLPGTQSVTGTAIDGTGVTPGTAYQLVRTNAGATASEWGGLAAPAGAALSYTANDAAPTTITDGVVYDVPTTGAASTITLPAAAHDGAIAFFTADGTKNAHTVQYRDATGPTNLTTALTASKRHFVVAIKAGGKWFANASVSP